MASAKGLDPGRGKLTIGAWADPKTIGGSLAYRHRLSEHWFAGAQADAWRNFERKAFDWRAFGGIGAEW